MGVDTDPPARRCRHGKLISVPGFSGLCRNANPGNGKTPESFSHLSLRQVVGVQANAGMARDFRTLARLANRKHLAPPPATCLVSTQVAGYLLSIQRMAGYKCDRDGGSGGEVNPLNKQYM